MKRLTSALFVLSTLILALSVTGTEIPTECTTCIGLTSDRSTNPAVPVPLLVEASRHQLKNLEPYFASMTSAQRSAVTLLVTIELSEDIDPIASADDEIRGLVGWARDNGPFASIGIRLEEAPLEIQAYALKRLAVTMQGLELARRIIAPPMPLDRLAKLYETGVQAYFDELLTEAGSVASLSQWLLERDPIKKIAALVRPAHSNVLFDGASSIRDGARTAFVDTLTTDETAQAIASFNREFAGDYAFDPSTVVQVLDRTGTRKQDIPTLVFVRGEDLRSIIIPAGDPGVWTIAAVRDDTVSNPRRIDASGAKKITDSGKKNGQFLIGLPPGAAPFALSIDRPPVTAGSVTKESIEVVTRKTITVEEIIRNHQAYRAYQDSIQKPYIASNDTRLRFGIGQGGEAIEATIAGPYFVKPGVLTDWVWKDFLINGVRWKYGRIPEIPIIQAEKVSQVPLDIHLTNEYRYELVRETDLLGFRVYEVRFEPPPNAPPTLPLYRGTVWIDQRTWARIRVSMIQLNLEGEILSNDERVDYIPFDLNSNKPLSAVESASRTPRDLFWLPGEVGGQQVLSTAGRSTVVQKATTFSHFEIAPPDFDARLTTVGSSSARMVRETDQGLRYLEKNSSGDRVVQPEFDTSRLFLLGGLHHDAGLEFPVIPLGGIDYFNFNLNKTGIQTNIFFAGIILSANMTDPSFLGTRTNVGADFFGLAVPFTNGMHRNGVEVEQEAVKTLPLNLTLRAGHPIFTFGKADLSLGISHLSYQRAEKTARDFAVPSDTLVLAPTLSLRYDRRGYSFSTFYDYGYRTAWEPWGRPGDYSSEHKQFSRFGASFGKSFFLPNFQRVSTEINYLDSLNLDRFSKYELGFFGAQRIRGIESGSVRAEKAVLGHLSYGFVFSQQFRLEGFYDIGLLDDDAAGMNQERFQGVGIGGQTIGPYGTLVRFDLGKTIGENEQDGFVGSIVFLKLF